MEGEQGNLCIFSELKSEFFLLNIKVYALAPFSFLFYLPRD